MELVVLLDESGNAIGVRDKAEVHHHETPLHLAFSCYVFDQAGRLLLTQRAHHKVTWPGVWTNSCCGHPAPSEPMEDAIRRRLRDELGLDITTFRLVLPEFRYQAIMASGVMENEICPVFAAFSDQAPHPNPEEVADTTWVEWVPFATEVLTSQTSVSPWCHQQVAELMTLGEDPTEWPEGDSTDLPAAAR